MKHFCTCNAIAKLQLCADSESFIDILMEEAMHRCNRNWFILHVYSISRIRTKCYFNKTSFPVKSCRTRASRSLKCDGTFSGRESNNFVTNNPRHSPMAFTILRGYKLRANYRERDFVGVKNKWFMDVIGKGAHHGEVSTTFSEDAAELLEQ